MACSCSEPIGRSSMDLFDLPFDSLSPAKTAVHDSSTCSSYGSTIIPSLSSFTDFHVYFSALHQSALNMSKEPASFPLYPTKPLHSSWQLQCPCCTSFQTRLKSSIDMLSFTSRNEDVSDQKMIALLSCKTLTNCANFFRGGGLLTSGVPFCDQVLFYYTQHFCSLVFLV